MKLKFLVIPYRREYTKNEFNEKEDLIYFAFFQNIGSRWKKLQEVEGAPEIMGDIDGDGVPEIKRQPYCDGDCVYYEKFYPSGGVLAFYSQ